MSYAALSGWVLDKIEELVAQGVSRDVAEREMHGVEWAAVQDLIQSQRDNQLLLCFEEYGSQVCAKRWNVSPRTIRDWRQAAIDRRTRRRMAAA